ncbi:MarR family winged helix-turn-helix transcriptional regulator [Ferrovibrio sp.]|uniref:MarR family winged helix-turn-helix transcriptional regulator n=1 Tax=Ferrovibrio sp. TaxID=1917215 RepID=UPI00342E60DF
MPRSNKNTASKPLVNLTESVAFRLLLIGNLLARPFIERIAPQYDLSLPEWRCMVVLAAEPGLSNKEISERTGLDAMSISRALRRLNRHRRLVVVSHPIDGRRSINKLTEAGLGIYIEIATSAAQRETEMLSGLTVHDVKAIVRVLEQIERYLRLDRSC